MMETVILQYKGNAGAFRRRKVSLWFQGLIFTCWLVLIINTLHTIDTRSHTENVFLFIASLLMIIGVTLNFAAYFLTETLVIYEKGVFIRKKNYSYNDILSIRITDKSVDMRLKYDGTYTIFFNQFINITPEEARTVFMQLEKQIVNKDASFQAKHLDK